jgi:hypothetical protein
MIEAHVQLDCCAHALTVQAPRAVNNSPQSGWLSCNNGLMPCCTLPVRQAQHDGVSHISEMQLDIAKVHSFGAFPWYWVPDVQVIYLPARTVLSQ